MKRRGREEGLEEQFEGFVHDIWSELSEEDIDGMMKHEKWRGERPQTADEFIQRIRDRY